MQLPRPLTRLIQLLAVLPLLALIAACGPQAETPTPLASPTANLPQPLPTTLEATATAPAGGTATLPGAESTAGATAVPTDATTGGPPVSTQPAPLATTTA